MNRNHKTEMEPVGGETIGCLRCAIYTRKSSEEGLDQNFNSLDAQRESAEAFIVSQRAEGLVALPERYDDGGFSGGNLDRPAVERLLADIRDGKVDCVVVYKVDRLSRSLIDFARLIEIFDKHNVSFVSVTQQFNTTNSLGRLTLNVLLSFAQFEREIIAERTRDKIAAARRKGKWIGGRPMLGYDIDPRGNGLTVNPDEALKTRAIFKLYLDHNALTPVACEIDRRGWRTKEWTTKNGAAKGGSPFTKGRLFRLLRNPIYIGKVQFMNQIYEAEHQAIVEVETWQEVQQTLKRNGLSGGTEVRDSWGVLLKDILHCDVCQAPMVRISSTQDSRRHHHYVCSTAQKREKNGGGCCARPVNEAAIETLVMRQISGIGSDPRVVAAAMLEAEQQTRSTFAELSLERHAAQRELTALRNRIEHLGEGTHRDRVNLHERIAKTDSRLTEILQELNCRGGASVNGDDLRLELARFEAVWEFLKPWEQVRMISSLIDRIAYNVKTNKVTVRFRSMRIREMLVCQMPPPTSSLPPAL